VRILFPGTGMLVLSAWCLGVLNSHHRFLLSYTAPVALNAAMIATLVFFGDRTELPRLARCLRGERSWAARCSFSSRYRRF
jgi:putative peptidoglycan lipid II flippase